MAFSVIFSTNTADPKVVDKGPYLISDGSLVSATLSPTAQVTLENPTFVVDYNPVYLNYNYLACQLFNRYYYIVDKIIEPGKKIELVCEVDPLMSFKGEFLNCIGCVTRSESVGKPTYVVDNRLPVDTSQKEVKSVLFTGGFDPAYGANDKHIIFSTESWNKSSP